MKEAIYSVVDFFTSRSGLKKKINNYDVQLPARYINYFPSDYEAKNFNFLQEETKQGDTILDIGAHIGLFAVIAAKLVSPNGKVYAFEPTPKTNDILHKTIAINHLDKIIEPRNEAMGKSPGKTTFYISDNIGDNGNSLVSYKKDRKLNGIEVTILTVDDFVKQQNLQRVDFIKIDVEGAELDTLLGAIETFENLRPACILAIHPEPIATKGDSMKDIYNLVKSLDYHIYDDDKNEISLDEFCSHNTFIDLHLLPKD